MRKFLAILALTVGALLSHAQADTGLAMRCDAVLAPIQTAACTGSRSWARPVPGDTHAYLSYPTAVADSTTISWNDPKLQFIPWVNIPGNAGVGICTKDLTAAQAAIPVGGPDQCAPGADAVLKPIVAASTVVLANSGTGTAKLAWIAPTQNTDGSALTDLAGYNVYQGSTAATLAKVAGPLSTGTLTYTAAGLAPGTYVFSVTAVNAAGVESDPAASTPSTITKQTKPGSPAQVTVTITVSVP